MEDKNKEIKVIQISSTSPSFFLSSGKGDKIKLLKDDWLSIVAYQLKRYYPNLDVECWTPEKDNREEFRLSDSGVTFRTFPTNISVRPGMELSISMVNALKKEIDKAKEENKKLIIHFHEYHSWQIYLILYYLKKDNFVKIIGQHHGGRNPFANLKKYRRLLLALPVILLMNYFEKNFLKRINIFYALSDSEIEYLKGITENSQIKFKTMGISQDYFEVLDKIEARKTLGFNLNKKYIIYLGRLKSTKGIRELFDSMKELKNENIELVCLGEGEDFNKYKQYAKENDINNIIFVGAIYGKGKFVYLSAVDYMILPSHTEGAPVVLMEGIARNIPVISTNVGGVPKMIEEGREGMLIKPKSKEQIIGAIRSMMKWEDKDIRKYAEKYKWERIIKEIYGDYLVV